uniref:Reverse transcriptase domain-containing protein n=1 Tax=Cannabis sativa TaxID=3483 RepID=A0A803NUC3_CANSA
MALKFDMSKAYDRVEWGYLQAVLTKRWFDNHTTSLLMSCVTSARYQIAHASKLFGSIIPGRGLRQGDPLSSYLFIICTEGFSALLKHYEHRQQLRGIQIARGAPTASHMFFANGSYIFCRANERATSNVQSLLNVSEQALGQKINPNKSSIFFSRNTDVYTRDVICGDMGIHEADDHGTYLGLPNIIGLKKSAILGFLKEKVQKRIQSWDGKLLSKAGKEILLKTIVQALPTYAMSVFLLPIETSKEMERAMCKYWWSSSSKKDKNIHWMSWDRICKPKLQGGLGFRNLYDFNVDLFGKQAEIGGSPSFVWRSIMEAQPLLKKGAAIRVCSGASVNILNDPWLRDISDPYVHTVCDSLLDKKKENLGNYSVKSAYAIIQEGKQPLATPDLSDGNEHWTLPNVNTIKINTDAVIFSSTNCYCYSCVARSHNGTLLEAKAKCVRGVVSPEVAEAIGIHEALSWIKEKQ